MSVPLFQVDAFTDKPYSGNPAAVCILTEEMDEAWMQSVAAEMNLSETAYLVAQPDGAYDLRWFTPTVEVDLCGHATLASAHVLWTEEYLNEKMTARFHTRSGLLICEQTAAGWITMDFPTRRAERTSEPPGLLRALGLPNDAVQFIGRNVDDYLVEVDQPETVHQIKADFAHLATFDIRGVMVTSRADQPGIDFVSRFFAPGSGIDEDPVTGSAHCCLAAYWSPKLEKRNLVAHQASARGGILKIEHRDARVILQGQAVTVLRGELLT